MMMSHWAQNTGLQMEFIFKREKLMENSIIQSVRSEQTVESDVVTNNKSTNCDEKPENTTSPEYKLNLPKLHGDELLIPKLSVNCQTNAIAVITAAIVASNELFKENTPQVILSLYFGVYNIYLEFLESPIITHYLHKHGYKVIELTIEEWTSWISLKRRNTSQIVARYMFEAQETLPRIAWTLLGPLICLLGHKPTHNNIVFWGNKMLRTFQKATNLTGDKSGLLYYPSVTFATTVSTLMDEMHDIRRHLFVTVYNTASSSPCLSAAVCRLAVHHLKGVNLLDFVLIDQFILTQNPFSLLLNNIAKHSTVLLQAYDKYVGFGRLAPWCTLAFPPEELQIFQDEGFKYVAEIARGVAYLEGLTELKNYHPHKVDEEIEKTVVKASNLLKDMKAKSKERKTLRETLAIGSGDVSKEGSMSICSQDSLPGENVSPNRPD